MNQPVGVINDADPNAITIEKATARILSVLRPPAEQECLLVSDALGRYSSQPVLSPIDVPAFRASAMDGYALRVSECAKPLKLSGKSLAGHPGPDTLSEFTAQRIMTGARVPDDADAVVQQENVTLNTEGIVINQMPTVGQHIRLPGSSVGKGATLMPIGERIGPATVAMLFATGIEKIQVQRRLKIAVFSTGDELVSPGTSLHKGQIYDSNRALLMSMLEDKAIELIDLGIVGDTEKSVRDAFDAAKSADIIVSSGGVSVGEADYVKDVVATIGKINLWKVAMKPGRPVTFGELANNRWFFGLPGNPVSAALTCLLFVKPAIEYLCGSSAQEIPSLNLPLKGHLSKNPGRVEYQRAVLDKGDDGQWLVSTTGMQDSHILMSLHRANCLIELPTDSSGAEEGEIVKVIPLNYFSRGPL